MGSFIVRVVDATGETVSEEMFLAQHSALRRYRQVRKDVFGGVYGLAKGTKVTLERVVSASKTVVKQLYEFPGNAADEVLP